MILSGVMSNVRVTVFDIAIPVKSKIANNIEHDYNLPLGIQSIAFSLSQDLLSASRTDCLALVLACLKVHGRRKRRNLAP